MKDAAASQGRDMARERTGEHFIKNKNAQVSERNTYGHDPLNALADQRRRRISFVCRLVAVRHGDRCVKIGSMQAFDPNPAGDAAALGDTTGVNLRRDSAVAVLTARGEFDMVTTPQLQVAIREALLEAPPVLVLDLTEVAFFSSAAIGALVEARDAAGERTELRLAVGHYLDRTVKLVGLRAVFALYPSASDALVSDGY
ncbi:STAS domain-containing protein [Amycolatopsis sp. NPDC023774]|uniref:STAS domain-containing protein n=1 Tax=Amycolatopsis sp. NPDC023774 TaxID=3155015 RepID=UPI0033EDBBF6